MQTPETDTQTLIKALRILANDIQSDDGVANAAIAEGADRIEKLIELVSMSFEIMELYSMGHKDKNWTKKWLEDAEKYGAKSH